MAKEKWRLEKAGLWEVEITNPNGTVSTFRLGQKHMTSEIANMIYSMAKQRVCECGREYSSYCDSCANDQLTDNAAGYA